MDVGHQGVSSDGAEKDSKKNCLSSRAGVYLHGKSLFLSGFPC
jgi:hypothetical protein